MNIFGNHSRPDNYYCLTCQKRIDSRDLKFHRKLEHSVTSEKAIDNEDRKREKEARKIKKQVDSL